MNPLEALKLHVVELESKMQALELEAKVLDHKLLGLNPPPTPLDFAQLDYRKQPLALSERVWKDECSRSFATPYSPGGGLFLNLSSLSSVSPQFVEDNWLTSGKRAVYLHQEWLWVAAPKPHVEQEAKRLAITPGLHQSEGTCEKLYSLRVGPNFSTSYAVTGTNYPKDLIDLVQDLIKRDDASRQIDVLAWEASSDLQESIFARILIQEPNPPKISSNPLNWKCQESGIRENLWLNLSDGYIGSGRANWDGTGGTGAALKHFVETGSKYPLAVKLGTISKDGKTADVYSYAEDDMVIDPLLVEHLAHFGIVTGELNKTDRSMSEMEVDLNASYDWSRISQEGEELAKVSGSHCVGLENLGNSCYCNSVYQLLFGTGLFAKNVSKLPMANTSNPERDLAFQLQKLSNALNDPVQFVRPLLAPHQVVPEQDYVSPRMLKHLLGEGHREFSGREQQDAVEYVLHVLDRVKRIPNQSLTDLFGFAYEQKSTCLQSNTVKYDLVKNHFVLSLNVEQCSTLQQCLEHTFHAKEAVDDFMSPETGLRGGLERELRLQSFPKLLLVQLKRFVLKNDMSWEAIKLDGKITLPVELNLESFASRGIQPGEVEMRSAPNTVAAAANEFQPSEQVVQQILELGFSRHGAVRAAKATGNDPEQAMQWVMEHMEDADFNDPLPQPAGNNAPNVSAVPAEAIEMLGAMGFEPSVAQFALQQCGNNVERAADFLFSRTLGEIQLAMMDQMAVVAAATESTAAVLTESRYHLRAVVSHIGKSTGSGHYVCHFNQSPSPQHPARWVFFNDDKVVLANHPPLDLGYLLLYEQI
ncbi:hypothetical protein BASA81_006155 [Batrachochytrium salamandrivorans]|nr:hypothetical protein BASA81_006155 [Batrachochytrium salamandrivorans]